MYFIGEYFKTKFERILNDSVKNGADTILQSTVLHALLFVGLKKYGKSLK